MGDDSYEQIGIVSNRWHSLMRAGKLDGGRIEEFVDIATGASPARQNDDEIILNSAGGMPVEGVAWATEV